MFLQESARRREGGFFYGLGLAGESRLAAGERDQTGDAGQASSACRAARSEAARGKVAKPGMRAAQPTAAAMTMPRALESAPRRREKFGGSKM